MPPLFERKHKIIAFADDKKWAWDNGLAASLRLTKLSFSRRVDWRRVDLREKRDLRSSGES